MISTVCINRSSDLLKIRCLEFIELLANRPEGLFLQELT